jgi:hypothetical protein
MNWLEQLVNGAEMATQQRPASNLIGQYAPTYANNMPPASRLMYDLALSMLMGKKKPENLVPEQTPPDVNGWQQPKIGGMDTYGNPNISGYYR